MFGMSYHLRFISLSLIFHYGGADNSGADWWQNSKSLTYRRARKAKFAYVFDHSLGRWTMTKRKVNKK